MALLVFDRTQHNKRGVHVHVFRAGGSRLSGEEGKFGKQLGSKIIEPLWDRIG